MIYINRDIATPIVPSSVSYYKKPGDDVLDYRAICCFVALGFFLDDDTYYVNQKAFRPSTTYKFDLHGNTVKQEPHFQWHYSPREIPFKQALEEFSRLLEGIVDRDVKDKAVILPISGGLDSRTLAAALRDAKRIFSYSYEFEGGPPENFYGAAVARELSFTHQSFVVPQGYLWNVIKELATINGCYADFINPRQMATWQQLNNRGDIFMLGHGGDIFFDSMGVPDNLSFDDQHRYLLKKLIKPTGLELGNQLWREWGLPGDLNGYLSERLRYLLEMIPIENANARLRAFKMNYYVARWTAVNLELFKRQKPISLPFMDDAMCRFICTVPEKFLAGRQLEIEYLKSSTPGVAAVPWQEFYPCNLYNYSNFQSLPVLARRGLIKGKRIIKRFLFGKRSDVRNWELQFLGKSNDTNLRSYLFSKSSTQLVPPSIQQKFYERFRSDPTANAYAMTMLLTLALFGHEFLRENQNGK